MNRDFLATRSGIIPGAVTVTLFRHEDSLQVECHAERRPITRDSIFASELEGLNDAEEFILRGVELTDTPPSGGDTISLTDEAGQIQVWTIQRVNIEQRRTRYRCLCNKNR